MENKINTSAENPSGQQTVHKRRVRYSGTHPRSYKEKYKELNPEKYGDTIEKVISKGGTPAGMHISICVNEILDFFQIQPGQQGLDADAWIRWPYEENAGMPAGTGASLCIGCGSD